MSDFVAVDEIKLTLSPRALSDVEAAALPVAALTAWQALEAAASPSQAKNPHFGRSGQCGRVRRAIREGGWRDVIATAAQSSHAHVRSLGADEIIDYRAERFEDRAKVVDIVLDFVGGETLARSWAVLSPAGIIVSNAQSDLAADLSPRSFARAASAWIYVKRSVC